MTDLRSLEQTLSDNLPWNKARIKFVARFLLALFSQRTVNLARLATAFSGPAREASHYKRLQRFLHQFEVPYAQVAHFVVRMLGRQGRTLWHWIARTGKSGRWRSIFCCSRWCGATLAFRSSGLSCRTPETPTPLSASPC